MKSRHSEQGYAARLDLALRALNSCRSDCTFRRRDDLDQCPATIKTTLKRLKSLLALEQLEERKLLLLGDDDLLSVAISALGLSTRITVVDLDDSLLSHIARWTKSGSVELRHHDLRLGLPESLADSYDVVFTDPPYTPAGQLLFMRAGLIALRGMRSSSLFLCASRLYFDQDQIQMIIGAAEQAGLQLIRVDEDFNEYEAPPNVVEDMRRQGIQGEVSCFYSSLFHFRPKRGELIPESLPFLPSEIYKYEEENVAS